MAQPSFNIVRKKNASSSNVDEHTLYVITGICDERDIKMAIDDAMIEASTKLDRKITSDYRINVIYTGIKNEPSGFAFIYLKNPEVYYILTDRNPDGSDRIEYVDDPDWQRETPKRQSKVNDNWADWNDMVSDDDEEEEQKIPQKKIQHDPIVTLKPHKLTEQQIIRQRDYLISKYKTENVTVDEYHTFFVYPALAPVLEAGLSPNILFTIIPENVELSEEFLRHYFEYYCSNTKKYPIVRKTNRNGVTITFDPLTNEARFALFMSKKKLYRDNQGKYVPVFFQHAKRFY